MAMVKTTSIASTASGSCSSSSNTSICIRVDEMGLGMVVIMNVLELEGKMVFWRRRRGMNMMAKKKVDPVANEGSLVGEV